MRESKGGTGRAYLSEPGQQSERGLCQACGMRGDVDPFFHAERYGHMPVLADDTAELARILGETEPDATLIFYGPAALSSVCGLDPRDTRVQRAKLVRKALAESLAAVTADGGPLDELAFEAYRDATAEPLVQGAGFGLPELARQRARQCYTANLVGELLGPDPVILAAQRDLAVLSAYAQQVRA